MKTGVDTNIQWKQEHYGQDVIKSYSSYICHTLARQNTQPNSILSFPTESPLLRIPLPFSNSSIPPPPFLEIFGKINHPPLKRGWGWGVRTMYNLRDCGSQSHKILRKLSNTRPNRSLLTIYKSFMRPHLDYVDVVYDQIKN